MRCRVDLFSLFLMRSSLLLALMSLIFAWPLIADDKPSVGQKLDALEKQLRALGFSEEEIKEQVEKARKKNERKPLPKGIEQLKALAEKGDAKVQFSVGRTYFYGEGIEIDRPEAVKWFRKAAQQGYSKAQHSLGLCYFYGEGVEKDRPEAVKWFRKAAQQDYADAQFYLGLCYAFDQGFEKNAKEAVKWFRKAAEQDYADSQYELGRAYFHGWGIEKDLQEAFKWLRKAADQNHTKALNLTGQLYYYGMGVQKNLAVALKYLLLSNEKAKNFSLANRVFKPRDIIEGVRLYREASREKQNKTYEYWVKAFLLSNYLMTVPSNSDDQIRACKAILNSLDGLSLVGVDREASVVVEGFSNYVEELVARKKKQPDIIAAIGLATLSLAGGDVAGWANRIEGFTEAERAIAIQEADAYAALTAKIRKARVALSGKHERNFPMFFSIKKD